MQKEYLNKLKAQSKIMSNQLIQIKNLVRPRWNMQIQRIKIKKIRWSIHQKNKSRVNLWTQKRESSDQKLKLLNKSNLPKRCINQSRRKSKPLFLRLKWILCLFHQWVKMMITKNRNHLVNLMMNLNRQI